MTTTRVVTRFTGLERALHFVYLVSFLTLSATGFVLFLPQLQAWAVGPAGEANRLIHRLAAVALMGASAAYFWFGREQWRDSLRWILRWNKADRDWLRPGLRFYWTGDRTGIPPQGKFNTGQKANAVVQGVCFVIFVVTGLVLWFWSGAPFWIARSSLILHDVAFLLAFAGFMVHFYLTVIHPRTREHAAAMVDGTIPEEDARKLYPLWYERVGARPQPRA